MQVQELSVKNKKIIHECVNIKKNATKFDHNYLTHLNEVSKGEPKQIKTPLFCLGVEGAALTLNKTKNLSSLTKSFKMSIIF